MTNLLPRNEQDNPTCPKCSGYNAMLMVVTVGKRKQECRDCGYTIVEENQ